jgi:hypothetical protein
LVFAVTDTAGRPLGNGFNVIFEYSLTVPSQLSGGSCGFPAPASQVNNQTNTTVWAARWHHLGTHASFDAAYMADLISVTSAFTDIQFTGARSFISQVRTNDGALDAVREFRQFQFVPSPPDNNAIPRLRQAPVSLTPADQFRGTATSNVLTMVLNSRLDKINRGLPSAFPVAVRVSGQKEPVGLMGASALLPGNPMDFHWEVSSLQNNKMARNFSVQTCTGCHGGDTRCEDGCHLKTSLAGDSTVVSTFLSKAKPGTVSAGSPPPLDGEMRDRAAIFNALVRPGDRRIAADLMRILEKRNRRTH